MSWRGGLRLPSTRWSQINSVLSLSISWRSTFASKMSSLSRRSSSMNASSWMYQFIDRSKVTSTTEPASNPISPLFHRSCCSFFDGRALTPEKMTCEACGYTQAHHLARFSLSDDLDLIDSTVRDHYGNTPLHHAAAAGNALRVIQLMYKAGRDSTPRLNHRNSEGSTFLHVFRKHYSQDFPDFMTVLRYAHKHGLRFSEQDHKGRSIRERLLQAISTCNLDKSQRREVHELLHQAPVAESSVMSSSLLGSVTVAWALPSIDEELEEGKENGTYLGVVELESSLPEPKKLQPSITTVSPRGNRSSTFLKLTKPPPAKTAKLSILERDSNGDTLLLSALKKWSHGVPATTYLKQLIQYSDVHARDCHEYTALAIAARRGLRDAVALLLDRGANPNTKSLYRNSVLELSLDIYGGHRKKRTMFCMRRYCCVWCFWLIMEQRLMFLN